MNIIRVLSVILVLSGVMISCRTKPRQANENSKAAIPGQWLILYPDHKLRTQQQREAYNRNTQDSIVSLSGLKMIAFRSNGEFREADSILQPPAKWMVKEDDEFMIDGGGEGFRKFRGKFEGIQNDTMQISENVLLNSDTVRLVWYLKRLDDKDAKFFFNLPANWWRQKPAASESDPALLKRVKAMLEHYAVYFSIVSKESAYFLQTRVPLPFRYYQHAMGLLPFKEDLPFNRFFYNTEDARKAHEVIAGAMRKLESKRFPSGKDFVIEYATYLQQLQEVIK